MLRELCQEVEPPTVDGCEILHHFETMAETIVWHLQGNQIIPRFLRCRISQHSTVCLPLKHCPCQGSFLTFANKVVNLGKPILARRQRIGEVDVFRTPRWALISPTRRSSSPLGCAWAPSRRPKPRRPLGGLKPLRQRLVFSLTWKRWNKRSFNGWL